MKTSLGAHRTVRKGNFNFGTFRSIYLIVFEIYQALYRTSKHSKPHEENCIHRLRNLTMSVKTEVLNPNWVPVP